MVSSYDLHHKDRTLFNNFPGCVGVVHFLVILKSLWLCTTLYLFVTLTKVQSFLYRFVVCARTVIIVYYRPILFRIEGFFNWMCRSKSCFNVYILCSPILSVHFILINHIIIQWLLKVYQYFSIKVFIVFEGMLKLLNKRNIVVTGFRAH